MMELIAQNMAPIMFGSLILFLLLGYPVAFALAANGLLFFVVGVELAPLSNGSINLSWPLLSAMPDRIWGQVLSNDTMLAVPFFTFMGIVLEKSGMAEDLLETIGQLFGRVRGGLAYAVVIVGALLAATTGVVAASVIAMGLISLPIMMRYGYDRKLASGVIAASGTLAQIIPPSLVLIVLADQLGRSAGDMFQGALIPSMVLTGAYVVYVMVLSILRPQKMPALPPEARTLGHGVTSLVVVLAIGFGVFLLAENLIDKNHGNDSIMLAAMVAVIVCYVIALIDRHMKINRMSKLAQQVVIVLIPPLALVGLVLGTIFLGIATPTEGGAMGAVGALLLSIAKGRLTFPVLRDALASTTRLSAFVMFILIGARFFSLAFYGVNGHLWVEHLLTSLPGGEAGFLIVVSLLVFFLAFFLDYFELAFIIVPLLAPAAEAMGIDLIWFGVIIAMVMQTSFMHPPFGFALFFLRSVAPRRSYKDRLTGKTIAPVKTTDIYWGAIPFLGIQLLMVLVIIAFPQMVMHYKGPAIDISKVEMKLPEMPSFGGGLGGLSPLGAPGAAPATGGAPAAPGLGLPPLGLPPLGSPAASAPAPASAPATTQPSLDLSQPPTLK